MLAPGSVRKDPGVAAGAGAGGFAGGIVRAATTVSATFFSATGLAFTTTLLTSFPVRGSLLTTLVFRTVCVSGARDPSAADNQAAAVKPSAKLKQKRCKMFAPESIHENTNNLDAEPSGNPFFCNSF